MPNIRVDYREIENAKTSVGQYVRMMENSMRNAQRDIMQLSYAWQGSDYEEFKTSFARADDRESAHEKMRKALDAYVDYLSYAKNQYKAAQIRAVGRASCLPRW